MTATTHPPIRFTRRLATTREREAAIREALDSVADVPNQMLADIQRHPRDAEGRYPVTLVFRFVPPWEQEQEANA